MTPFDIKRVSGRLKMYASWISYIDAKNRVPTTGSTERELLLIAQWLTQHPDTETELEAFIDEQDDSTPD